MGPPPRIYGFLYPEKFPSKIIPQTSQFLFKFTKFNNSILFYTLYTVLHFAALIWAVKILKKLTILQFVIYFVSFSHLKT